MDTEEMKEKILAEIAKTEQRIKGYEDMAQPVTPDVSIGRISRMDAINNNAVTESALRQAKEKVRQLKYALSRVEGEDFGICISCHGHIPPGRILLKPESLYCVSCAM
jgi:DnaK suppressor protein